MKVKVYGTDHSPWVQAVLLALHEKGIEHTVHSLPSLEAFRQWGVLAPSVSINDAPWEIESSQILVKLGLVPISDEDLRSVQRAWQGAMHRSDNPFRFFAAFARAGDTSPSVSKRTVHNFLRSFMSLYGLVLISIAKWIVRPREPEDFGDQFLVWERIAQSSSGPFLDGDEPGIRDMMLFGMVQCHSSIPMPPLEPLSSDERLAGIRQWIANMHERFRDYPHLYSGRYFEPHLPQPLPASPMQRAIFYLGLVTMFAALPLTLPLVLFLMSKVPR